MIHLKLFLLLLCLIFQIGHNKLYSKDFDFICNPKLTLQTEWAYSPRNVNIIKESLNHIDFSVQDFEFRYQYTANGQTGPTDNLFVLKHFNKGNKWKAYFYVSYKDASTHKSVEEYFTNSEIIKYSQKDLRALWDTLLNYHVLTLEIPDGNEIEKIINRNNPDYPNLIHVYSPPSHSGHHSVKLIKQNCIRSYAVGSDYFYDRRLMNEPTIKEFNMIVNFISGMLK